MGERGSVNRSDNRSERLPRLIRRRPRSFIEWSTLRRWGKLPPWEVDVPGFLLREARHAAGLTQAMLADRLGITQQAVSQAERWNSNPTIDVVRRWLAVCGQRLELHVECSEPTSPAGRL
jgi:DNA-binding XRE family transcriptional regulator